MLTKAFEKGEKRKMPIQLQAIRSQVRQEDGVQEAYAIKEMMSSTSNGMVPNVPTVSPEEHFAAK